MMITNLISDAARFALPCFIALGLQATLASRASAAPLINGGFESPDGPPPVQVSLDANSNYVTGWAASGNGMFYEGPGTTHEGFSAQEGSYAVSFGFNNNTGNTLSQTFDTVAGQSYTIGYSVRRFGSGTAAQSMVAEAFDATNSALLGSTATTFPSNGSVLQRTLVFTATSASTRLQFRDTSAASSGTDNSFWILDNVARNYAATFTVTNTNDTGAGSLREALAITQAGDTIDFAVTGTITLSSTLPVTKSLTIQGPAAPGIIVSGNNAVRVFRMSGSSNVTLSGLTISNGRIDQTALGGNQYFGAGILNESVGTLTLTDCTVSNNTANNTNQGFGYGAGIYSHAGSALVIANSTFSGNVADGSSAAHGSAIYTIYNGGSALANVTITNSIFSNNVARSSGGQARGAIVHPNGQLTITGSTFSDNVANGRSDSIGGAIFATGGTLNAAGTAFTRNSAGATIDVSTSFGGAIALGTVTSALTNCTFTQNTAIGVVAFGGGIQQTAGPMTLTDLTFTGNTAAASSSQGAGGAVYSGGPLTVSNTTLTANSVSSSANLATGGAIQSGGGLNISNSRLLGNFIGNNSFIAYGGVIFSDSQTARSITNTTISDNYTLAAVALGGPIMLFGPGSTSITGCTLSGNYAESTSIDPRFSGAPTRGGVIYNAGSSDLQISNSTLSGNRATSAGSSAQGGAIYNAANANLKVNNSTIVGNLVRGLNNTEEGIGIESAGGGIYNEPPQGETAGGTATLRHAIVAGNSATNFGPDLAHQFVSQGFNLIGNGDGSSGIVHGTNGDQVGTTASPIDPRLAPLGDYGGPTLTHALLPDSPARNAGDPAFPVTDLDPAISTDQRGLPRVRNGRIDIGAYEAPPPAVITAPESGTRTNGTPTISGTAEPGFNVVVRITDGTTVFTVTTTADANGNWSVNSSALPTGNYSVVAGAGLGNEANVPSSNTRSFVADATPPVISGASDQTREATGPNGASATYSPTATDDFDGSVPVSCSAASGSTFPIGSTSVVCSATDAVGNTATSTFIVTVQDTTPPTITIPAEIVVYNEAGKNGANVAFDISATDVVDGPVTPTVSPASGSLFRIGTTTVTVTATDSSGNSATRTFNVTVRPTEMANISTRVPVGEGDNNAGIGGFIVRGSGARRVVVRAMGPSVNVNGARLAGALHDPTLELYRSGEEEPIARNDNWQTSQEAALTGSTLAPGDPRESAILVDLPEGSYTAVVRGAGGSTGIALVEVYALLTSGDGELGNISTRGQVLTVDNVLIGGVIVRGGDSERLLFRAIGPKLAERGVENALQDPTLELRDENGELLIRNDNWRDSQEQEIEDTNMAPEDDRESAIVATLAGGNYTAVVRGNAETTGIGLVEVFSLPPAAASPQ